MTEAEFADFFPGWPDVFRHSVKVTQLHDEWLFEIPDFAGDMARGLLALAKTGKETKMAGEITVTHVACWHCLEEVRVTSSSRHSDSIGPAVLISAGAHGDGECPWGTGFSCWVRADNCVSDGVARKEHMPVSAYENGARRTTSADHRLCDAGDTCLRCGAVATDVQDSAGAGILFTRWERR